MTKNTVNEIERMVVTRVFDAPRELVWKAWTDPKYVMQWWGARCWRTNSHVLSGVSNPMKADQLAEHNMCVETTIADFSA